MSNKKKKKSLAESIIDGTYKAGNTTSNNKSSIADSIINGTYNSEEFFPSRQRTTISTEDIAPVKEEKSVWSNILTNTKAIGSNLLKSAESGILQFSKTFQMRNDETINSRNKLFSETTGKLLVEQAKKKGSSEEELNKIKEKYGYKEIDSTGNYQKRIDKLSQQMAENVEKTTNPVAKKVTELSQSMGNTLVGMGISAVNPLAGLTYFTGSATGSYYDEGLRRGMTKEEAKNYGAILGGIEGTLDKYLAASNIKGVKSILEGAGAKNVLKAFGLEIGENFVQEAVMPSLSEVTTLATAGKEHLKYDFNTADGWKDLLADSWSDGVDGALSAILLGGTTRGVSSAINVTNKLKNGQQVSQTEIAEAVKESQEAGVNVEETLKTELTLSAEKKLMQEEQVQEIQEAPVQQELFEQPNAQQFTSEQLDTEVNSTENLLETKEVVQPKQEAEKIIKQIEQEQKLQEQTKSEAKRQEIQARINELEAKLEPLQAQVEAENTVNNKDKITSLESLKAQYDNPLVQEAIDNQITKLKQETQEVLEPTPASQELVEAEASQNLQSITDEDIAPTKQESQNNEDNINKLINNKITMTYVRNPNTNTQNFGDTYGQNIEPSGEYMSMDTMQGKYKIPDWEYGKISFEKPLILEHKDTTANGWKKDLSERYNGLTGKKLSTAIKKDGYDAIMTRDEEGNFIEVVNLNGTKLNDQQQTEKVESSVEEDIPIRNDISISEDTTDITTRIKDTLGLDKKATTELYDKVSKANSVEETRDILEDYRDINEKVEDDEVKEIRKHIRTTKKDVSQFKSSITDYGDFYKKYGRKLNIGNGGTPVDTFYQELSSQYPQYFDSRVTNVADQLEAIQDFMDNNQATYTQKVGEISNEDLNKLAEEYYAEVHANEFNKFTDSQGAYKDIDSVVDPEALKEDLSREVKEQVKDIKSELKSLKTQLKELQAPIKEVVQELKATKIEAPVQEATKNPFELTDEQNAKIQELRADTKKWAEVYKERYDDKKFANKRIKGVAMQNAAEIRKIIQGDALIDIEGGLTSKELNALTNRLRSNYIGKPVLVNGKEGTITGNAYGKIGVEFTDGTKQYVDKNSIQPLEDIDSIIKEQQRMYEQYKQEVAPEPQKQAIEQPKTEVKEIAPIKEKVAQNENTKQPEIKKETQVEEKVAQILSETPTQANKKQRLWAKFRAGILDKGSVFEDLSIRNKNRELMSKWDYMQTAESRAQSVMMNGTKEFDSETKTETQVSKSLNDIQAEVGDKVQEFSEYLYHKHNISRMSLEANAQARMEEIKTTTLAEYDTEAIEKLSRKRITEKTSEEVAELIEVAKEYVRLSETKNKPVFGDSVTADVSKEVVNEYEMNNPEFMDWAKDVYDYNNANLNQLVKSGVISQETADQFAEIYPNYVPIGRANKNGNAINVPLDTNRTTINTPIKGAKGGNSDILPLFDTLAKRTIQTYRATAKNNFGVELKNTLKSNAINQTTNVDEVLENVDQQENLLQEGKDGKAPTFTVFENGEKVTYDITQDMYEALKPVSDSSILSTTFKPFNKISNFHRGVLTEYNPVFMLTNAIKDAQDILMNSQHAAKTYAKFGESYAQIVKKGYWYQEYMANGGEQNSYFDSQEGTFNTERKGIEKVLDTFPLKQISQLNNVIEMAPRLAEYIASRESGRSIETSMLDAARVTTNFKAGGDITKWANRNGATFLNASIQGAMQQVRNIREANANGLKGYANLALKFTMAGVPALLLNGLLWDDDEEYEELSDYVKQNYYIVGKYGDGNFIRIPKGRMVSVIQESFNQMKHLVTGDGEADLGQFLEIMGTNIAPNNPIENNVLSPIIQAATNTTWYGDDLVPTRLQDEPVKEQFDESTDKLSIFLGQNLGISPYKINYVLDQYSGGIGDVFLPMMTQQAETGTDNVASELIAPLTSKFTVDSVMKNQNVSDLYSKSEELTSKANSTSATDEDILQNKYLNSIKSEMNVLYKEKREIQSSNLSDSEKYEQVREIQEQINSMAKNAMENYEKVNKTSNYATIGNKEYYLKNDTWTKVDKEELEELNSLDMDVKAKSTYFDLKSEISEIKDSKAENKKSQIATAVKNTDLTDMQKAYVYGKNYSSDETLDLVINTGISFNEYLDYASQEFVSDKNSEGKTINGSRKKKVYDYLNSMNIDYEQKLILAKMEYPAEDRYNYEIIDYLNNNNSIDYATMESILIELGFNVDKDGNIKW